MTFIWSKTISFDFNIGRLEKHTFTLQFNRIFNHARIKMNGRTIKRRFFIFNTGSYERQIDFKVGDKEKHEVAIHFQMPNYLVPSFYPWIFTVYEDGKEIKIVEA